MLETHAVNHVALTVSSIDHAITRPFGFGGMPAIFIRDRDRNVIELDAYSESTSGGESYEQHL